jgi:hypothetical protein
MVMLLNIILHRLNFAPAAAMLEEVKPGSQEEGRAAAVGRRYPHSTLWGWDDIGV